MKRLAALAAAVIALLVAVPTLANAAYAASSPPPVCQSRTNATNASPIYNICADIVHAQGAVYANVTPWCDPNLPNCTFQVARLRLYVDGKLWKERTDDSLVIYYPCNGSRHQFQAWVTYVVSFPDGTSYNNYRTPLTSYLEWGC